MSWLTRLSGWLPGVKGTYLDEEKRPKRKTHKISHINMNCRDVTKCRPHGETGPVDHSDGLTVSHRRNEVELVGGTVVDIDWTVVCKRCGWEGGIDEKHFHGDIAEMKIKRK